MKRKPKPPKGERAGPAAHVLHDRIAREALATRTAAGFSFQEAGHFPALGDLMESAREALEGCIPATFDHAGKTYYLRVSVGMARLMVFEGPADAKPMAIALAGSDEEFGHLPAH